MDGALTYGFGELDELVLAYAATIHKTQGSEYPAVIIRSPPSTMRCCSEISSTTGSRAVSAWSFSGARRRPSRSQFAMYRAGDAGRSLTSGFGSARPPDRRFHRSLIEVP